MSGRPQSHGTTAGALPPARLLLSHSGSPGCWVGQPTMSEHELSRSYVLRLSLPAARLLLCHSPARSSGVGPPSGAHSVTARGIECAGALPFPLTPGHGVGPPTVSQHELLYVKRRRFSGWFASLPTVTNRDGDVGARYQCWCPGIPLVSLSAWQVSMSRRRPEPSLKVVV